MTRRALAAVGLAVALVLPVPAAAAPAPAPSGATAAEAFGWGPPTWADEFDGDRVRGDWQIYDGPGHAGNGVRRPGRVTVSGGVLTQSGTADARSAGMLLDAASPATSRLGRWEVRARADQRSGSGRPYHLVVALIPVGIPYAEGERDLDFAEADIGTGKVSLFLHHPPWRQQFLTIPLDQEQWHTFGLEVAESHLTWFVDGAARATTTRADVVPISPMALNLQLDAYRPSGLVPGRLQVDWARFHPLPPGPVPVPPAPAPADGAYDPDAVPTS